MKEEDKKSLLKVARTAVAEAVAGKPISVERITAPSLQEHQGAFVTLKNGELLRGCIGRFTADIPLYQVVREMAVAAATEDPRFFTNPITREEVGELTIEISVLSPLERIANPLDIELGKHGIYIRRGYRSGCFLPQVATETGWSKEQFLSHCAEMKAGLPPDSWKDPKTEVYVFTALIIGEEKPD